MCGRLSLGRGARGGRSSFVRRARPNQSKITECGVYENGLIKPFMSSYLLLDSCRREKRYFKLSRFVPMSSSVEFCSVGSSTSSIEGRGVVKLHRRRLSHFSLSPAEGKAKRILPVDRRAAQSKEKSCISGEEHWQKKNHGLPQCFCCQRSCCRCLKDFRLEKYSSDYSEIS